MFYTHVASVLTFAAQVLFVGLTFRQWFDQRKSIIVAFAALTLPYIPIALWAVDVVGGSVETWHSDFSIGDSFRTIGTKFATFRSKPEIEFRAGWIYFIVAAVSAMSLLVRAKTRSTAILLLSLAIIPSWDSGSFAAQLGFSDRYVIGALPAYLLLIALGLAALSRSRPGFIAAIIVGTLITTYTWYPVSDVNRSEIAQKEDWRSAYARVAEQSQPNDVYLLHPGYMISTLAYHGDRDKRLAGHPVGTIPSYAPDWMTREVMIDMLREDFAGFTRFWLIESPDRVPFEDPDDELETWLTETGDVLYQEQVNGARVTLYELPGGW